MNKTVVEVPEGISYLSEWREFVISLPQKHFILNTPIIVKIGVQKKGIPYRW